MVSNVNTGNQNPPTPISRYLGGGGVGGTGYLFIHYWPPVNREPAINVDMVNAYVQTHISRRRCKTRRLIRVSTVCLQNFLWFFKKMKISANTPNIWNSLVLSIEIGKFIRLIWVNIQTVYTKSFWDTMITEKWMRNLGIQTGSVKYLCTFLVRKNVIETEINVPFSDRCVHYNTAQKGHYRTEQ